MKQRLLLVDDDEVFLRPLHRTLELAGYEVLPVQSGEEALDTLKTEDVDLVLTDKRLPGMDGVSLVRPMMAGALPDYIMPDYRMTVRFMLKRWFTQHLT